MKRHKNNYVVGEKIMLEFYNSNQIIENDVINYSKKYGFISDKRVPQIETFYGNGDDIQTFPLTTIKVSEGLGQVIVDGVKLIPSQYQLSVSNNSITFDRSLGNAVPSEKDMEFDDYNIIISSIDSIENRIFYDNVFIQQSQNSQDRIQYTKIWFSESDEYIYKQIKLFTEDIFKFSNIDTPLESLKFLYHLPTQMPVNSSIFNPDVNEWSLRNIYNYEGFYNEETNKWYNILTGEWQDDYPIEVTPPDYNSEGWVDKIYINELPKKQKGYFWIKIEVPSSAYITNITSLSIKIDAYQEDPNDIFS